MKHPADDELDRALCAAYEPDPEVVSRTVAAALSRKARRPGNLILALGFAALLLVGFALLRQTSSVRAETYQLKYVGGVAVLEYPDGSSWLFTPESPADDASAGVNLIIVGDEK